MTRVSGSEARQPITSPTLTSASLPVITQSGAPIPALRASVARCEPNAPDWLTMLMSPSSGHPVSKVVVKVGNQARRALKRPSELGPSMRMPCPRAIAARFSCARAPSSPISAKPDENTTAALQPRRPSDSSVSATCDAGTATTAASGASGSDSTEG